MSERKTKPGGETVSDVLAACADPRRREDTRTAVEMMQRITGVEPVVWGGTMIGFGHQPYTTADGVTRDYFAVGLAPRKAALTFYGLTYDDNSADLLAQLGPHTTGKGCLYVKRLDQVDADVLGQLVAQGFRTNHVSG